ncbi:hypothetical protein KC19_1G132400 [Ceratodon purpureus]|uniref:Uncharacterized protein n=1 Tax=Ceratodon purpureus TaxID=3225 RepID=A0A8T0J7D2_CERPU|nr:hypothetical protein KC19_1G132400 [Ceratodon purpureus]
MVTSSLLSLSMIGSAIVLCHLSGLLLMMCLSGLLLMNSSRLRRSTIDLNAARLLLLLLHLRHHHCQHAVVHLRGNMIQIGILGEPELAHEAPAAALHAVPGIRLLHLLPLPLPADAQRAPVLDLHLHVLLPQPRQVGLEHMLRRRPRNDESAIAPISTATRN